MDTIAAISTPAGEGGIGIVRTSGERSLDIMRALMEKCPEEIEPRHAYYGRIVDPETSGIIDEAIIIYMKAPHTYTCEDVLEIQSHGGIVSLKQILRAVLSCGARMAEPGEFTKLAFMNGRIDLTQAEAVIDIIKAKNDMPHEIAASQLEGRLSEEVREIRSKLVDTLAEIAVNIDFPDEDIEEFAYFKFIEALQDAQSMVSSLLATAESGKIARDGLKVAIVGKPNVGKSSLMNALLGEARVIVTSIPGTTRDTVEESINIGGISVVLVDTAGMRDSEDIVEAIGIERSKAAVDAADLVLFVVDSNREIDEEDHLIADLINAANKRVIVVINKNDLETVISENDIIRIFEDDNNANNGVKITENGKTRVRSVKTSLTRMSGSDAVKDAIAEMLSDGILRSENGNMITNERHREALQAASRSIGAAIELLERHEALEIAEVDIHDAFDRLGDIIGETAGEEILDAVFSRFCLGK